MSKNWPTLQWGLLPILVVPVVLSLWQPVDEVETRMQPNPPKQSDYYMRGARISVMNHQGQLLYQLRSQAIIHYPDDSATMDGVHLYYEGQDAQRGTWVMAAEHGLLPAPDKSREKQIRLSGDVRITGQRNANTSELTQMRTASATVYPQQGRFVTTAPIELTQGSISVTAENMRLDSSNQSIHLKGNVRVTYGD